MDKIIKNADLISTAIHRDYIFGELGVIFKMKTENFLVPFRWLQSDNWLKEIIYTLEKVKFK